MKNPALTLVVLIMLTGCVSFQPTDPALLEKPFSYIIPVPNKSAQELQKLNRLWIANTYRSAEKVISFQDDEQCILKGQAIGEVIPEGDFFLRGFYYLFSLEAKDTKVRIIFSDIREHRNGDVGGIGASTLKYQIYYDAIKRYFDVTAASLEQALWNPPSIADW
jgi:hypothetical protein